LTAPGPTAECADYEASLEKWRIDHTFPTLVDAQVAAMAAAPNVRFGKRTATQALAEWQAQQQTSAFPRKN
jgi:hypothetical protein